MNNRPFRRSAFVSPFGPGAMSTAPDGTSAITAGLDYWFAPSDGVGADNLDISEFEFHEWRLQSALGVSHFRLPPDYRTNRNAFVGTGQGQKNLHLSVPLLRFPRWHRCPNVKCQSLYEASFSEKSIPQCNECKPEGQTKGRRMLQVQFVAVCDHGHIQDFPWREWVHRSHKPTCTGKLHLHTTSGGTLKAIQVVCECKARRDLEGILGTAPSSNPDDEPEGALGPRKTFLSQRLEPDGEPYVCKGIRPWLSDDQGEGCGQHLQGTLRGATNVYFATVGSSIFLPMPNEAPAKSLLEIVEREGKEDDIQIARRSFPDASLKQLATFIRSLLPGYPEEFFGDEAMAELFRHFDGESTVTQDPQPELDNDATRFRRPEFSILRDDFNSSDLLVRSVDMSCYDAGFSRLVSRVQLVPKLRETRAFAGFSRINPVKIDAEQRTEQLWRTPVAKESSWLPAYKVFGEGIYLELDEPTLATWERSLEVTGRIKVLSNRVFQNRKDGDDGAESERITPRFVMVHTLAHLLINQLVFDCGYSSAALRERLYVSSDPDAPMAGLLIYTASGDSEGTMGGLVRMGKPGWLENVFSSAIRRAQWCSSDPVCMEMGKTGQGPGSCNLAACHSCALLPETSCEEFNRFLDRWTVVGEPGRLDLGYFAPFLEGA